MMSGFFERGGAWVLGQAVLLLGVVAAGWRQAQPVHHEFAFWPGVVLLAAGAICGVLGTFALGRNLSPFPGVSPRHELVRTGIYAWMRHPLYTGLICASLGWSLLRGRGVALVISLALALFLDAKARSEEASLTRRFPEYPDYQRTVKKFLPWLY